MTRTKKKNNGVSAKGDSDQWERTVGFRLDDVGERLAGAARVEGDGLEAVGAAGAHHHAKVGDESFAAFIRDCAHVVEASVLSRKIRK